uniref:Uncharacterized protein n=1 Tax=viral metagenome TaxID=1070528 RepID=A0A6C0ACI8_9ZZZZ
MNVSQAVFIRIRNKIFCISCNHGLSKNNYLLDSNSNHIDLKIEKTIPRFDLSLSFLDNETENLDNIDNVFELDELSESFDDFQNEGFINYFKYKKNKKNNIIRSEKKNFKINIANKKLEREIDFTGPKIPFIYSLTIPNIDKLNSLSGSPLIVNEKLVGILLKIKNNTELVFLHSSVIKSFIKKYLNGNLELACLPINTKEIVYGNKNKGYMVTSTNIFYEILKPGDIISNISNKEDIKDNLYNDKLPLETFIILNKSPEEDIELEILRQKSNSNIFNKIKLTLPLYNLSETEIIPYESELINHKDLDFTDLNTKLFFDLKLKIGEIDSSISDLIKKGYSKNNKWVIILKGKKIYPKIINKKLTIPIIVKINDEKVTNSKNFLELLQKNKSKPIIEYSQGGEIKKIKI